MVFNVFDKLTDEITTFVKRRYPWVKSCYRASSGAWGIISTLIREGKLRDYKREGNRYIIETEHGILVDDESYEQLFFCT